jgi:hypothetical protein
MVCTFYSMLKEGTDVIKDKKSLENDLCAFFSLFPKTFSSSTRQLAGEQTRGRVRGCAHHSVPAASCAVPTYPAPLLSPGSDFLMVLFRTFLKVKTRRFFKEYGSTLGVYMSIYPPLPG